MFESEVLNGLAVVLVYVLPFGCAFLIAYKGEWFERVRAFSSWFEMAIGDESLDGSRKRRGDRYLYLANAILIGICTGMLVTTGTREFSASATINLVVCLLWGVFQIYLLRKRR